MKIHMYIYMCVQEVNLRCHFYLGFLRQGLSLRPGASWLGYAGGPSGPRTFLPPSAGVTSTCFIPVQWELYQATMPHVLPNLPHHKNNRGDSLQLPLYLSPLGPQWEQNLWEKRPWTKVFSRASQMSLWLCVWETVVCCSLLRDLRKPFSPSVFATQTLVVENGSFVLLCTRTVDAQHMHT